MTREESVKVLSTVLRNTATDCDYAYDHADFSAEIVPGADIAEALGRAIDALREQEERRWIPVTERLPDEWVDVLVWSLCGFCEVAVYLGIPGKWRVTWNHDVLDDDTVTHWMPLPEPPKEE